VAHNVSDTAAPPLVPEHTAHDSTGKLPGGKHGHAGHEAEPSAFNIPQWGMIAFLVSEVAFFGTLIVGYLALMGRDTSGPKPADVFKLPLILVFTACLLSSSFTVHFAEKALHENKQGRFRAFWLATIVLGAVFLLGTAYEWWELIEEHHLTISRNLFGTSYYTLVGFHAMHVTGGVVTMSILFGLALRGHITAQNSTGVQVVSWYWHFVDVVWVLVFFIVYIVSVYLVGR
jgi:cytochrome c oxidase subunit 3/cytochrome o ubiquinol oxidase subunit 3